MPGIARALIRPLFRTLLNVRLPLPGAFRAWVRDLTRAAYHRSPLFQHDSRLHAAPLALRVIHECVVQTHPDEFSVYGGRLRFRSAGSPMSVHGYYVGEFEYHLVRFMVGQLRNDSIVLDIGAHHGEFAIPLGFELKQRHWNSSVWSFEPDPGNLAYIRQNLELNGLGSHVRPHMLAVSDTSSDNAELLCPADNSSNTLSGNASFAIGEELPTVRRLAVSTIRVDDLDFGGKRVALIKLDIQGSEPDALRGAVSTLTTHRPIVVVEVVESWPRAAEVRDIFSQLGYTIHGLSRSGELVPIGDPRVFVSWDWVAMPGSAATDGRAQLRDSVAADGRSATHLAR